MNEGKIIGMVIIISYFVIPHYGYSDNSGFVSHLLWPMSHANVWHLAGNVLFLWLMKGKLNVISAYIIAIVCSFLPAIYIIGGEGMITCGFSGVIFAMVGERYGRIGRTAKMMKCCIPWILIGAVIPHINWAIHLYCLAGGWMVGETRRRYYGGNVMTGKRENVMTERRGDVMTRRRENVMTERRDDGETGRRENVMTERRKDVRTGRRENGKTEEREDMMTLLRGNRITKWLWMLRLERQLRRGRDERGNGTCRRK